MEVSPTCVLNTWPFTPMKSPVEQLLEHHIVRRLVLAGADFVAVDVELDA
jgi:hypothetical protein